VGPNFLLYHGNHNLQLIMYSRLLKHNLQEMEPDVLFSCKLIHSENPIPCREFQATLNSLIQYNEIQMTKYLQHTIINY